MTFIEFCLARRYLDLETALSISYLISFLIKTILIERTARNIGWIIDETLEAGTNRHLDSMMKLFSPFVFADRKVRVSFVSRRVKNAESDGQGNNASRDGSITESSCSLKLQLRGFRIRHETFSSCRGPMPFTLKKRSVYFALATHRALILLCP